MFSRLLFLLHFFGLSSQLDAGDGELSEFVSRDVSVGSSTLSLRVPATPGERSLTTAAAFYNSIAVTWDVVVEHAQAGLVDAKIAHLPQPPLSSSEAWHHRAAVKAGHVDSARLLITFGIVPSVQAGGELIHLAASAGDAAAVRAELDAGVAVDVPTVEDGHTPLLLAVAMGHTSLVKFLLGEGANVEARGKSGATSLMIATSMGHDDVLRVLLAHGADVSATHAFAGTTALHFAAEMGRVEAIKMLCAAGASAAARTVAGGQPLHTAADTNQTAAARALIASCNADVSALLAGDSQPLYMAAQRGFTEVVEALHEAGADLDWVMPTGKFKGALIPTDDGSGGDFGAPREGAFYSEKNTKVGNGATALHAAVENGHARTVERMLELGAKQLTSMEGASPLLLALQYKHPEIALICLRANASDAKIDARTPHDGVFPLITAIRMAYWDVADALLAAGASVTIGDHRGETALSAALRARRDGLAQRMMRGGALNDETAAAAALFACIESKHEDALRVLLSPCTLSVGAVTSARCVANTPLPQRREDGARALHVVARSGWLEACELLISAGADLGAVTKGPGASDDFTALHIAASAGHANIVSALLAAGANVSARSTATRVTPLLLAASGAHAVVVKLLLSANADVNEAYSRNSNDGAAALAVAAGASAPMPKPRLATVTALLDAGANANARSFKLQSTPLLAATRVGDPDVVAALLKAGASPHARDARGMTALHVAALANRDKLVPTLVSAGGLIDSHDDDGRTPLAVCVRIRACAPPTVHAFLAAGADVASCDANGESVLFGAVVSDRDIERDKPGLLKLLVGRGAFGNPACSGSALQAAVNAHDVAAVGALISATRAIDSATLAALIKSAPSALPTATRAGDAAIVVLLLDAGADPDAVDSSSGRSSRDEAVSSRNADVIKAFSR